jgi:hypothetical protein
VKYILVGSLLASMFGCSTNGGTETDNPASPLKDFASSVCKSKESDRATSALTLASDVVGLECVEWEAGASGELLVKLHNFAEACAESYAGKVVLSEGGADLSVFSTTCAVAKCFDCLYDFDFHLVGIATDAPLALRIGSARCASAPAVFDLALTLPLDTQPSGIVCQGTSAFMTMLYAASHDSCGERNMPCGDCAEEHTACLDGLVCTELAEGDSRCLQSCETNADCVANLTCESGLCRAPVSF